jgi:hypothetical protein
MRIAAVFKGIETDWSAVIGAMSIFLRLGQANLPQPKGLKDYF